MTEIPQRVELLATRLAGLDVTLPQEDGNDDPPAHALAYDLAELEDGSRALSEGIARFREAGDDDAWWELREEIRHLLYHLRAPAFADLADRIDR